MSTIEIGRRVMGGEKGLNPGSQSGGKIIGRDGDIVRVQWDYMVGTYGQYRQSPNGGWYCIETGTPYVIFG